MEPARFVHKTMSARNGPTFWFVRLFDWNVTKVTFPRFYPIVYISTNTENELDSKRSSTTSEFSLIMTLKLDWVADLVLVLASTVLAVSGTRKRVRHSRVRVLANHCLRFSFPATDNVGTLLQTINN